jgi:hypothetical protein
MTLALPKLGVAGPSAIRCPLSGDLSVPPLLFEQLGITAPLLSPEGRRAACAVGDVVGDRSLRLERWST